MATITGLKLTQLSVLSLGSTGTRFYAVSAGGSSFQIYEKDLYNTLNVLHISGVYQSKLEDWRFVHKSGTESITGSKTFVNPIISDSLLGKTSLNNQVSLSQCRLVTGGNPVLSWGPEKSMWTDGGGRVLDWSGQKLMLGDSFNSDSTVTIDWKNRILSGNNWTKDGNYILTSIDSGNMVVGGGGGGSAEATGIALHNQVVGLSGALVNTGANLYNYLRNFSGNFQSFTTPITPLGSGSYPITYPLGSFPSSPRIYCTVETSGITMYAVNITGRTRTGFWAQFSNTISTSGVILHTFASLNS